MSKIVYMWDRTRGGTDLEGLRSELARTIEAYGYSVSTASGDEGSADFLLLTERETEAGNTENKSVLIVTDDEDVLSDTVCYRSAEEIWETPFDVGGIVLLGELRRFSCRFTGFSYSPMCLVHVPSRSSSCHRLVSYWIHKSGRKVR
ncbi:hypothetical protein [Paenibacillus sp. UNC499MF]|uniref:hypothetical protein n=1 Tax=Paenibacillus sp. UNC499MF TaxID=1502751 RepID=UPI0008A05FFC|nr:hypothetical protein [Paenibacillus sp. UNC499MF]SEF85980.1 hypothetical protein SAMN02799616_01250 [Paenibacillus sp. UNC499MF]